MFIFYCRFLLYSSMKQLRWNRHRMSSNTRRVIRRSFRTPGTNDKRVCDFLLVINSRRQHVRIYWWILPRKNQGPGAICWWRPRDHSLDHFDTIRARDVHTDRHASDSRYSACKLHSLLRRCAVKLTYICQSRGNKYERYYGPGRPPLAYLLYCMPTVGPACRLCINITALHRVSCCSRQLRYTLRYTHCAGNILVKIRCQVLNR